MANKSDTVQSSAVKILLTILATAIITMIGTIILAIQDPFAKFVDDKVPKTILLLLPVLLLLLLIIAMAYIINLRLKMKNPMDDYEFIENAGIMRYKKDNTFYCLPCLYKGIKSPLKVQKDGWQCLNDSCGKFYRNPEYKSSFYQTEPTRRSWLFDYDRLL